MKKVFKVTAYSLVSILFLFFSWVNIGNSFVFMKLLKKSLSTTTPTLMGNLYVYWSSFVTALGGLLVTIVAIWIIMITLEFFYRKAISNDTLFFE